MMANHIKYVSKLILLLVACLQVQRLIYIYSQGGTRSLSGYPTPTPSSSLAQIDLTSTGTTCVGTLDPKQFYEIDLYIYIPEGYNVGMESGTTYTANLLLIYTPQTSETLP